MKRILLSGVILAGTAFAAPASAQTVVALVGERTLAIVDAGALQVTGSVEVTGFSGSLLGIDVRPADNILYGVVSDGSVVMIDVDTGAAKKTSTLETTLAEGVIATVDFNPAADRLRLMGSDGVSLRVNVDTGEVAIDGSHEYAAGDPGAEMEPMVVAGAYTNSIGRPGSTDLYNIDAGAGVLVLQSPPNDGVINTIGPIGVDAQTFAFDILSTGEGMNTAYLMADDTLFTIDLSSGAATALGRVKGADMPVRDIALLPAM
ncbi:MAG: DUF4394 domain-containing protein [Salinarimonadaceae bacterium]|nr:MAG: DUF4394 domain-containing protein [Salinarimonadaceae bacterium]